MAAVVFIEKGNQVQQQVERGVHTLIGTDALGPVPERPETGKGSGAGNAFLCNLDFRVAFGKRQRLLNSLRGVS